MAGSSSSLSVDDIAKAVSGAVSSILSKLQNRNQEEVEPFHLGSPALDIPSSGLWNTCRFYTHLVESALSSESCKSDTELEFIINDVNEDRVLIKAHPKPEGKDHTMIHYNIISGFGLL